MDKRDELRLGFETAYIAHSLYLIIIRMGRRFYLLLKMNF